MQTEPWFWSSLDSMSSGAGLVADWKAAFGSGFSLVEPFSKLTARSARSYPCPERPRCGCRHIVRETDWGLMAVCGCGPDGCDPVRVEPKDLMVHALDRGELGKAICQALGFAQVEGEPYSTPGIQEIGSYGEPGNTLKRELQTAVMLVPVYFATARHHALLIELEKVFAARPGPFLALTPAACTAETNSALQRHGCANISLSGVLEGPVPELRGQAGQAAREKVRELLAAFSQRLAGQRESAEVLRQIRSGIAAVQKQFRELPSAAPAPPISEDAARSAFALVQQLDSESRRQAPSVLTVFRLYCIEELSAEMIAKKCRCGKSTILRRLELIRAKTGTDPAAFRKVSTHLSKLEDETRDSRASHIHRKNLIYDDDGENAE